MLQRFILYIAMLLATISANAAANFQLIPPRNVVEGRNFALTFRLSNGDANPPQAPQLEGCKLLYGPSTSTMQSTEIINGHMTSTYSVDFTFTYRAEKAGEVQVPSISVSCEGRTLSSKQASFQILPPDSNQQPQNGTQSYGGGVQADDPTTQTPGKVSAEDLIVRVSFSKADVYEQEPVVATIKVYTKFDISSFMVTTQPAFEGFLTEELPVDLHVEMEHYNGQNYHTAVLKRLLLYPQRSGKLSVNSGKYDVTVVQYETVNMGFFRTQRPVERQVSTSSNAATINVNPLPEPKPAGFNGAVGKFSVETALEPELLRTNEAAVYSYTIKGTGNIKFLAEPTVLFPHGIDAYTPKTDIQARVIGGNNMSGSFRTDITFVPQEVGNFTIEGTPFVYFDLDSKSYVTAEVPDTPIRVLRGTSAAPVANQTTIDDAIDDILHIKPIKTGDQTHSIGYTFHKTYYWLAYVIVALILVSLVAVYRRHIRLQADVTGRRLAKASRVAAKRLKNAKTYMDRHENDKFYEALSAALWGYMSDKLSIPASQLTRDNISVKLADYGLGQTQIDGIVDVLDRCEMARFTPNTDADAADVYHDAAKAINNIENVAKR